MNNNATAGSTKFCGKCLTMMTCCFLLQKEDFDHRYRGTPSQGVQCGNGMTGADAELGGGMKRDSHERLDAD